MFLKFSRAQSCGNIDTVPNGNTVWSLICVCVGGLFAHGLTNIIIKDVFKLWLDSLSLDSYFSNISCAVVR